MKPDIERVFRPASLGLGMMLIAASAASGAPLCVNPGGTAGCLSSISAAVTAAPPGSAIHVAAGIYKESVTITKALSLIGADGYSIIDATGQSTGIYINGTAAAPTWGVSNVVISGFTVKNANFEGILVANATGVTISGNTLDGNNKSLQYSANSTCPGLPAFETNEGADCGEGLHLMAVDHSVVYGNTIQNNAGGILVSDETGPTYQNVIAHNTVSDNALDCGITLASHARAPNLPVGADYGVLNNTISHNVVSHNGYLGQGAGVGMFAPGPGAIMTANVVIDNVLRDNGIGRVTIHNHAAPGLNGVPAQAPPVNLSNLVISGNQISGNAADNDDPLSPGPTGISIFSLVPVGGLVISENVFTSEVADIVFNAPGGTIEAHLNSFGSNDIGLDAEAAGAFDGTQNWWGCPDGPGGVGCGTAAGAVYAPSWLTASPAPLPARGQ